MTFPYLNTFVPLLDITLYRIYLSILEHIGTSTGYHALPDLPFHTWTHSYFYWILCSTGYTFPFLNTFVLLLDIMLYWIYLSILEHIRTSTEYYALLDITFHSWTHSYFYWISCSTGYNFPYCIYRSLGYHALPDIPFHTWSHSYFYWISCSTGYTFPYLITFVLILNIILYWIYLSILQHIRTSTRYHVLLDIPFHTSTHSHFY